MTRLFRGRLVRIDQYWKALPEIGQPNGLRWPLTNNTMSILNSASTAFLLLLLLPRGCTGPGLGHVEPLTHRASGNAPETIALYEAWFGHPKQFSVVDSSLYPATINSQIRRAKGMGISAFVVDWYGDREPFIDRSYALMQLAAEREHFQVAMMYDETDAEDGATDQAMADFTMFHDTYLSSKAPGHQAYLTYKGHPLIFIFPKGKHTDWDKVRVLVNKWSNPPLLIYENLPGQYADAFDGYYAWISPGAKGWTADGSNWGEQYLNDFYQTMRSKYPAKIIVGGEWSSFDDSKASWGLKRHIAARCGRTFIDTSNVWHKYFPASDLLPFVMIETWNDHEEGTAIEDGVPNCASGVEEQPLTPSPGKPSKAQEKP